MDVTDVIGHWGRFQYMVLGVLTVRSIGSGFSSVSQQLAAQKVEFWCADDLEAGFGNVTNGTNQCVLETVSGNFRSQVPCERWKYAETTHLGIIQEWDLVCQHAWLISAGYFSVRFGNFLAYIPAGHIADKYGRYPVILIGQIITFALFFILVFSSNMWMFIIVQVLLGFSSSFVQNPILCLFIESVGPQFRDVLALSFSGTFGLGMVIMAGIAYFLPNWRHIMALIVPAQLALLVAIWWVLPESSRWLLSAKRLDRAEKQIVEQAKMNGKTIADIKETMDKLMEKINQDQSETRPNFLEIFKNASLRKRALILYLTFAITAFIYHGFIVNVGGLGGSIHLNIALSGLTEFFAIFCYYLIVKFFDRRRGLLCGFCLAGLTFLLALVVPADLYWLKIILVMCGRLANSLCYTLIYVFSSELFPTSLRVVAVSGAMASGRIGTLLAPFTDVVGRTYGQKVPLAVYAVMSLVTGLIFLCLPDTKNKHLADTVAESEKLKQNEEGKVLMMEPKSTLP